MNRKMYQLCRNLAGRDIQNITELREALRRPLKDHVFYDFDLKVYCFSDGSVWKFSEKEIITAGGDRFSQFLASEVSELCQSKALLKKENQKLQEMSSVEPRNKRGKTAKKVKDVKKIAISFTIVKNITAKTGERTLYIRIAKPDNDILTKNPSNTFPYENRSLVYSIKKYIEYTGEEQNVTVYWDVEEYLPAGTYHVISSLMEP